MHTRVLRPFTLDRCQSSLRRVRGTAFWRHGAIIPVLVTVLVLPSPTVRAHGDDLVSTQELLAYLADQRQALEGQTLNFVETHWYGSSAAAPPEEGPADEHLVYVAQCVSICRGSKYRFERIFTETHENLRTLQHDRETMTWNGAEARTTREIQPEGTRSGQINLEPPSYHTMQPYLSWQGWWVLQTTERLSYRDLLQRDGLEGPELMSDGRTYWRCPSPGGQSVVLIFANRFDGEVQLSDVEFRSYKEPGYDEEDLIVSFRLEFRQHANDSGVPLAKTFSFMQSHRRDNPGDEFWSVTNIRFTSAGRQEIAESTFLAGIAQDAAIADDRYQISYRLGDKIINLDGRVVETHQPLYGDVGHNLEWWIERGKLGPVIDPETGELTYPGSE